MLYCQQIPARPAAPEVCFPVIRRLLWKADDAYTNYRIPGMIVTDKGTLLACCEARRRPDDWAPMDILCKRSENFGADFSPPAVLARGTDAHPVVNNPVMVQGADGRIHFLYCVDYGVRGGGVYRRFSDDDGITWSAPEDITAATRPDERNVYALGPGHGLAVGSTLVVPCWLVPRSAGAPITAHGPSVVSTLCSRDNGRSWFAGDIVPAEADVVSPSETTACRLADGKVYMNIRCNVPCRAAAIGPTGYDGWQPAALDRRLPDPVCFGSVAAYDAPGRPYTVFFANCEHTSERKNVVLKGSADNLKSWSIRRVIDGGRGGYVETAVDAIRDRIYVLYEHDFGKAVYLAVTRYDE